MAASSRLGSDVAAELTDIVRGYIADQGTVMASSARGMVYEMSRFDAVRADRLFRLMSRRPELTDRAVHSFIETLITFRGGLVHLKDRLPSPRASRIVEMTAMSEEPAARRRQQRMLAAARR